jgi:hypothetical protein
MAKNKNSEVLEFFYSLFNDAVNISYYIFVNIYIALKSEMIGDFKFILFAKEV